MDILKDKWEKSYTRSENFIFYPKEEVVKFLNRFVRKRNGIDKFVDILDFSKEVKGLDYGCGLGRLTILMREFGIDAYGVDISSKAIEEARKLAVSSNCKGMVDKFSIIDGKEIPFEDNFFDLTISEGVLDSMYFELAKSNLKEIERVTKSLVFISLISNVENSKEERGERIVRTEHEEGTIQNYYDWNKIQELIKDTSLKIDWCHLISEESKTSDYRSGRYSIVLRKI